MPACRDVAAKEEAWDERARQRATDPVIYPEASAARDRFILDLRGPKAVLDPHRAYAAVWEEECDEHGALAPTAVVFLTNRECPFRCAMCDLWQYTTATDTPSLPKRCWASRTRRCSARL